MAELIELLPLPSVLLNWPHPTNHVAIRDYARACVAHASTAKDAEIEALRAKTAVTMGVGTGDGKLFVHGDYESIKAAQEIVLGRDTLRAEIEALKVDVEAWKASHSMLTDTCHHFQARAERLAEALRHLRNHTSVNSHQIELIDSALNPTAAQEKDDA